MNRKRISATYCLSSLSLSIGLLIVFLFSCSNDPGFKPVDFSNAVSVAHRSRKVMRPAFSGYEKKWALPALSQETSWK